MEKWLIWCDLNDEQDRLKKLFGDLAVSITGSMTPERKVELEKEWREGDIPILITKPKIFSFGLNWQHCHNMIFVGLSDSFEQVFQAIRRCYRFGQENEVNVHFIISELEGAVLSNIQRKERDFNIMIDGMVRFTKNITQKNIKSSSQEKTVYDGDVKIEFPSFLREDVLI